MAIYDKASLVLIPSGTKTSKVYSQVPTNGDGDFTFSRSTAATRVNASGNIEKETENLFTHSNTFTDSDWTKTSVSITAGQAGYDGSSDASLIEVLTSGAPRKIAHNQTIATGVLTMSIYAKAGTAPIIAVEAAGSNGFYKYFNLSTGTGGSQGGSIIDSSMVDVGGGWYRLSITGNPTSVSSPQYFVCDVDNSTTAAAGSNLYIQDAQLEQGLVARDYIETTTTAIYGGITDNVPRLDYTDSSCPALLLEPQRTNSINISEYFGSNGQGGGAGFVITDNYTESPEGYNNAARIQYTSGNTYMVANSINMSIGEVVTMSIYAKGTAGEQFRLYCDGSSGATINTEFTLTSDWVRYETTSSAATANGVLTPHILVGYGSSNPADDFQVYGWQGEKGSYATSYIPTYGSAVTRNEEILGALTGLRTNEITTTGAYTIFFDLSQEPVLNVSDGNSNFLEAGANDSSFGNIICSIRKYYQDADGKIRFYSNLDATTIGYLYSSNKKFCMVVNGTNVRLFTDGAKEYTYDGTNSHNGIGSIRATSGSAQRTSTMFSNILIFPNALTDQEAIDLTTT